MKVKIITIHCIHNFGSVFQAFSLQNFLIKEGYDVEIIDYRPKYFNSGRNIIKTYIGKLLNYRAYINRKKKFNNFESNHMMLTKDSYKDINELRDLKGKADVFIAGGDQIWNDYHYSGQDKAFKLEFINKSEKIAFGTSMGRDNYTKKEINDLVPIVNKFRFVGLREKSSVDLLETGGYIRAKHVGDPVILLDNKTFTNLAIKPKIKRYALVYLIDKSLLLDETINYIKKELGLKIVHVCGFRKKCKADYFLKDLGPKEILGLLINADFVVSASFHATLFSVLFNKNFFSFLPNKNTNARIIEFLDLVELKHRIIKDNKSLDIISEPINFKNANKIIDNFRESSKSLLLNTLKKLERI